jgi:hypothetical protein
MDNPFKLKVAPMRLHLHERSCATFKGFIYKASSTFRALFNRFSLKVAPGTVAGQG